MSHPKDRTHYNYQQQVHWMLYYTMYNDIERRFVLDKWLDWSDFSLCPEACCNQMAAKYLCLHWVLLHNKLQHMYIDHFMYHNSARCMMYTCTTHNNTDETTFNSHVHNIPRLWQLHSRLCFFCSYDIQSVCSLSPPLVNGRVSLGYQHWTDAVDTEEMEGTQVSEEKASRITWYEYESVHWLGCVGGGVGGRDFHGICATPLIWDFSDEENGVFVTV